MNDISKKCISEYQDYVHNTYQCFIAASVVFGCETTFAFELGSGQGKSMIALLISLYYQNQGKKTSIISPSTTLAHQLRDQLFMLSRDSKDISIVTPKLLSKNSPEIDVAIIDEADFILEDKLFLFEKQGNEIFMNGAYRAFNANKLIFMSARYNDQ